MAVSSMLLVLVAFDHFVVEAAEDELESVVVNVGCAAVSHHDLAELGEDRLGRNFKTLVLGIISDVL